jgi:ABC-type sugar transport system ATPase subunit
MTAIEEVGFDLMPGENLGIVGESGSGKSVTALSILGLHARSNTRIPSGSIVYGGRDLLRTPERDMRRIRGAEIAMIFQDPMSSLNPVLTVADQIGETLALHQGLEGAAARKRAIELLDLVRIPDAARRVDDAPPVLAAHGAAAGSRDAATVEDDLARGLVGERERAVLPQGEADRCFHANPADAAFTGHAAHHAAHKTVARHAVDKHPHGLAGREIAHHYCAVSAIVKRQLAHHRGGNIRFGADNFGDGLAVQYTDLDQRGQS